ncbi:Flavin-dependent monooxygenase [Psilocybe cubensis]|uniref:Flavin-dependent monooxygenase n=1 Tax=Psilocybe cubensis TaxID=181762 RepID=A0ACB8GF21_PSICU|nr:Flavin-dependent monooxygenase [Psilocybe cubensis]KAH9474280.1 Flavin-dependent monooxygenase [Psilocybe cubensis]
MSPTRSPNADAQILVVGAGPSGLILALSLMRHGVPVRIIEKSMKNRLGQRGAGITPRTLEVFESLGFVDEIIKRGIDVPTVRAYKMPEGVEILREFNMSPKLDSTPDKPYANFVMFGQDGLDRVLRSELEKLGCFVELGAELQALTQDDDKVHVKILHHKPDQSVHVEKTSYNWVVGADGARGVVRKQAGMSFVGQTTDLAFVLGDITIKTPLTHHWHLWGDISNILNILRPTDVAGVWSFMIGGRHFTGSEEIYTNEESLKAYFKAHTGTLQDIHIDKFLWISPYRISVRMVDTFQKGRILVTGDAGHVHSPAGGQGMNTGVQDSYNLGWKLALVAKGLAPPTLLETFNSERYPVVSEMLNITTKLWKQMEEDSSNEKGWNRTGDVHQLGVNYRGSPIVLSDGDTVATGPLPEDDSSYTIRPEGYVLPGDRAPDATGLYRVVDGYRRGPSTRLFKIFDATKHTVLTFADRTADSENIISALRMYDETLVRSILITMPGSGARIPADCITFEDSDGHAYNAYKGPGGLSGSFVIRPDGVVGARVAGPETLGRYFDAIFGKSNTRWSCKM